MTDLVTAYLERELTWAEWLRFQGHLGTCRHCRAYLRQMRATVRALSSMPAPPGPVPKRLLQVFREARPGVDSSTQA
jgi:anti-sigma factor RsiW